MNARFLLARVKIDRCGSVVKNPLANARDARDASLILGSRRSSGVGNGNPLQYSCLENFMDRGATIHRAAESDTTEQLSMHAILHLCYILQNNKRSLNSGDTVFTE